MKLFRCLWLAVAAGMVFSCAIAGNPLIEAAREGDNARLEHMLSLASGRLPVDSPDPDGSTALYWAAAEGQTSTVEFLLSRGASPSSRTVRDSTPLEVATVGEYTEIALLLLDAGAEVNVQSLDYGSTPLMLASVKGNAVLVRELLRRDADPRLRNHAQSPALWPASSGGHSEIVLMLLEAGADANDTARYDGTTALIAAAYAGHLDTVRVLLEAGADPNAKDARGRTALVHAQARGHATLVEILTAVGAPE